MATKYVKDIDRGYKAIMREIDRANNAFVDVGIFEGARNHETKTTIAEYATYNEFGATIKHPGGTRYVISGANVRFVSNKFIGPVSGITKPHTIILPSRPFMAMSFDENIARIDKDIMLALKRITAGRSTASLELNKIGLRHQFRIKNTITKRNILPKLANSTIRQKKGSTKTLVDTGAMVNAVTYTIKGV